MQHGDKLTLKDGREITYVYVHPDDGACHIGMWRNSLQDREDFITFERDQVVLVNGKPRVPVPHEVVNYLVPILNNIQEDSIESETGYAHFVAILAALKRDGGSMEAAIHTAMRECP